MSANGRFVAFDSTAANLVPGDSNGSIDVFVRDRMTGETTRESVSSTGIEGNNVSSYPAISADGRFVAFQSDASNLVVGDTNGVRDIFVRDRLTSVTTRASVDSSGRQGDGSSGFAGPALSADGRFVVFDSLATNLVSGDTNGQRDVFVHDRQTGETTRITVSTSGVQANNMTIGAAISTNGRFVAFDSCASNLVPGDTNDACDVFVRDRLVGTTERVNVSTTGAQAGQHCGGVSMSADGRFVAFLSHTETLVPNDTNNRFDAFVRDRQAGTTLRASVGSHGEEANGNTTAATISADGRFVAFESLATNLIAGDTNAARDIFLHDLLTGETTRVSVGADGSQGNGNSKTPSISSDGRFVAFTSTANDLVLGDTNGARDVFVRDRLACESGNVNGGIGPITDVLHVNGFTGVVDVPVDIPITLRLDAAPAGPSNAGYVLWIWLGLPENETALSLSGVPVGCTVNPTPLQSSLTPQPFRCLRGARVSSADCGSVHQLAAPPSAPWTLTRSSGSSLRASFTIQGVLEDAESIGSSHFSVTNAVVLRVQ
ncbi:MAG: PD40 domain-containing protein [Planctomycetes bacterium]|nr:PD40 domain-containing protein [Planctomycetota bacterium]MBI3844828.1 PD40 domain-containing protein [Planctomycetota bacterium]